MGETRFAGSGFLRNHFITTRSLSIIKSLTVLFVCLLFVLSRHRVVVVCSFAPRASILKSWAMPRGYPKIASPLRRNMRAQIYVNFDRYIPMNAGTRANLLQN
jgi:hypothetical protein